MIEETELRNLAEEGLAFFRTGTAPHKSSIPVHTLSLEQAYRVQDLVVERRIAQGEAVAGYKVGCTSKAIRRQFGLSEPISGRLMNPHVYVGETTLNHDCFVDCAVEPEFVLRIGREITGERLDDAYLRLAIEYVSAGIEVHNFRFRYGQPTSQELVASNGIHACLVIGKEKHSLGEIDLGMQGVGLWVDGRLEASAIGYEVMDGPLSSLRWLAKHLHSRGQSILPGQWVIPGSPVRLVSVPSGARVSAAITSFGCAQAYFVAPARG